MSSVKYLRNALVLLVVTSALAIAQSTPGTATQAPPAAATTPLSTADAPEISTQEQLPSFQVKVNLVEVRVVVRDAQGKAIGNLKQEDFVLLDDKKPQPIARFSVERSEAAAPSAVALDAATDASLPNNKTQPHLAGSWRLAYLFDDFNSTPNDLTNARKAANGAIDALAPGQLLAIYTLSGQGNQTFTDDKELLRAAVAKVQLRPQGAEVLSDCPPINFYIADRINNFGEVDAFKIVLQEVIGCQFDGINPIDESGHIVQRKLEEYERATHMAIDRVYRAGEAQSDLTFQSINQVLRYISQGRGQRTLVLLSPGFYLGKNRQADLTDSLNRAIAAGVVINTLDLRGVQAQPPAGTDISQRAYASSMYSPDVIRQQAGLGLAQSDTLMQMSNTTGGKYLHNTNDFTAGLQSLCTPPEFSYLLAFNPQNLKNDGKFHSLKVELKQPAGYTVQARQGYFAPLPGGSSEQVKREIAEAVFSQDEIRELPLRVQTQFFKSGDATAKILVLVHVDVRQMQFKKSDGRNLNELTVVSALFDRNANLVMAKSNTVKMHIKDETLAGKLSSGITVKSNFDVNPGSYLLRVVARDEQGKMLTQDEVVDVP